MTDTVQIVPATGEDLVSVYTLIKELATFEKEPDEPTVSLTQFLEDSKTLFHVLVAKNERNEILGMALYYYAYSTWKGKMIYLDDLVVKEAFRGQKIGKKLLDQIFDIARNNDVNQLRWQVLDWNQTAIDFYKKYNADFYENWITCKVEKNIIESYKP